MLLNLDIQFHDSLSSDDIEAAVDRLEKQIREKHPEIKQIFIEAETVSQGKGLPRRSRIALGSSERLPANFGFEHSLSGSLLFYNERSFAFFGRINLPVSRPLCCLKFCAWRLMPWAR